MAATPDTSDRTHLGIVVVGHVDAGKCQGYDTPILMANGSTKMIQDIVPGDKVMGDNSRPRNVQSTTSGHGPMYQVIPIKGDPYTVNDKHVLSFKVSNYEMVKEHLDDHHMSDDTIDISVEKFISLPKSVQKMFESYKVIPHGFKDTNESESKETTSNTITIKSIGDADYYGFELDGNGRYLMGDFTVTHNSTTTGHLLFKLGSMDEREKEKLQKMAEEAGKGSFAWAFALDNTDVERERGVTIKCTTKEFFTPVVDGCTPYHYTVIDAPGHRDFIKNMLSGASQADVALLMVPADGNFIAAIQKGNRKTGEVQGQTRQHARLCNLLGIKQLIVGINKMDSDVANYSEVRYNEVKSEVERMIKQVGYDHKNVPYIPMSGYTGENLDVKSDKMPWYTGFSCKVGDKVVEGHTLVDALTRFVQPPKRPVEKPFRMPVSGAFNLKGAGDIYTGRIEQGVLPKGAEVRFTGFPDVVAKAFTIEMHHRQVEEAGPGDNVGICLKGLPKEKNLKPGIGSVMYLTKDEPLKRVVNFTATVFVQEHPGQLKCTDEKSGVGGFTPSIHIRTGKAPCRMVKINWRCGKKTNKQKVEDPPYIEAGDTAEVVFEPLKSLYVEPYSECEGLGRVAAMDSNSLILLGRVNSVEYT